MKKISLALLCLGLLTTFANAKPGDSKYFGEKDWGSINAMTVLDGKLYVASALSIWEVDKTGKAKDIAPKSSEGWGATTEITSMDGKLYCINSSILYEVDKTGKTKEISKEWYSVSAMAALDGKLYIINDQDLYEVDKTGKYTSLSKDWYLIGGMVEMGGKLYVMRRGKVNEVDKTGKAKILDGDYTPTNITTANGKLYISSSEATAAGSPLINELVIFEVDTEGKRTKINLPKKLEPGDGISAMAGLDNKLFILKAQVSKSPFFSLDIK